MQSSATCRNRRPRRCRLAAAPAASAQVTVTDPWVRGTVAGQKATGAFMQLKCAGRRRARRRGVAGREDRRDPRNEDGGRHDEDARRRPAALPAGKAVELKPGGYHVMLMDLVAAAEGGRHGPAHADFEDKAGKKQTVEVKAPVPRADGAAGSRSRR